MAATSDGSTLNQARKKLQSYDIVEFSRNTYSQYQIYNETSALIKTIYIVIKYLVVDLHCWNACTSWYMATPAEIIIKDKIITYITPLLVEFFADNLFFLEVFDTMP